VRLRHPVCGWCVNRTLLAERTRAMMRKTVLVVDDQPQVRRLLRQILDRDGYKVLEAEDEQTAVSTVRHRTVDLALIDIELPGPNGCQVAQTLRALGIIDSVFITGLDPNELIADGRLHESDPLVRKPFTIAGVLGVVNAALRSRPQLAV
jgi:two-component system, OmpR family, response regulator